MSSKCVRVSTRVTELRGDGLGGGGKLVAGDPEVGLEAGSVSQLVGRIPKVGHCVCGQTQSCSERLQCTSSRGAPLLCSVLMMA